MLVRGGEGEMRSRAKPSSRAAASGRATVNSRVTVSCTAMTSNRALASNGNRATATARRAVLTATAAAAYMEFREVVSACSEAEDSASVGVQGNR
jgi:hypothetical protein